MFNRSNSSSCGVCKVNQCKVDDRNSFCLFRVCILGAVALHQCSLQCIALGFVSFLMAAKHLLMILQWRGSITAFLGLLCCFSLPGPSFGQSSWPDYFFSQIFGVSNILIMLRAELAVSA